MINSSTKLQSFLLAIFVSTLSFAQTATAPDFGYAEAGIIAVNHFAKLSNSDSALSLDISNVFGRSVVNLGDLDGTGAGATTIAVGTPNDSSAGAFRGAVYIVNINSAGAILGTPTRLNAANPKLSSHICTDQYGFGLSLESLGDLDIGLSGTNATNSVVTLAVGSAGDDGGCGSKFLNKGAVLLINLNSAGDIVGDVVNLNNRTTGISLADGDQFGSSIANLGDLDGAGTGGVTTIAVGAVGIDTGGSVYSTAASSIGGIHILNLDSDGALVGNRRVLSVTQLQLALAGQGFLGRSVENLGDLDIGLSSGTDKTNSVVTIAAGAPSGVLTASSGPEQVSGYPNSGGSVYLINLNASGQRVGNTVKIGDDTAGLSVNHGEGFGASILNLGDIDGTGSGAITLAIGNSGIDTVKIINFDENGAIVGPVGVINDSKISDTLTRFHVFGVSLANIGDINGDGIDEIAVGETVTDSSRGTLHIISVASIEHGLTTSNAVNISLPAVETGSTPITYQLSPSTLPAGLSFSNTARTITGTPTTDTAGRDYTLTATNSEGVNTFSFRLGVGELDPTPSSDNDLSGLLLSSHASGGQVGSNWRPPVITPLTLDTEFTSSTLEYTVSGTLENAVQAVIFTPTTSSSRATVTINGEDAISGVVSAQTILNVGQTLVPIVVTAEDGTQKTYTITINKAAGSVDPRAPVVLPDFKYGDAGVIAVNYLSSINSNTTGLTLADNDSFGSSVANLGDLDGAGLRGIIIASGASGDSAAGSNRGSVHLVEINSAGEIQNSAKIAHGTRSIDIADESFFGASVADLGDIGAGDTAIAISAPGADSIYIFYVNSDLSLAADPVKISNATDGIDITGGIAFGASIANLGDLDGSGAGATTIAVGAVNYNGVGGTRRGSVYLINITSAGTITGAVTEINSTLGINIADNDQFGRSVVNLGDLDGGGAGVTAIAVGANGNDTPGTSNRGAVHIINIGATGASAASIIGNTEINSDTTGMTLVNNEGFGNSIAILGDIDGPGTGITTLAVGTQQQERVHIINITSAGGIIGTAGLIDATSLDITIDNNDVFGSSVASIGDINDDGIDELIVGEGDGDTGGADSDRGELHIISFAKKRLSFSTLESVDITLPAVEVGEPEPTYVLSPTTLPAGLIFTGATRKITGRPTEVSAATEYTLTASNSAGTDTYTFNLETTATPTITINEVSGGYVNDAEDNSDVTVSGTSTGIAQDETITVTFSDVAITEKSATVAADGTWTTTIPSAQVKVAIEGTITVTAGYTGATNATQTFVYDRTVPVLAVEIPDQTATVGTDFLFPIPPGTFTDTNTLTYTSTGQANGITFATDTWSGTGVSLMAGTVIITVTATDAAGNTITDTFDIVIAENLLSTTDTTLENISVYMPSKNNLRIVGIQYGDVKLKAYNILGVEIINTSFKGNGKNDIAIPSLAAGIYIVHLEMAIGKVSRKVVVE